MRNSIRVSAEDDRRKAMNVRRSFLYNIIVKDNNLKSLKLGHINFESENTEVNEEIKVIESDDSFQKLAQESMGPEQSVTGGQDQRKTIDKASEKVLETLRMSYQVQIQNLATKFKTLLKEILERRLIELRRKFEYETKQIMNQFFDLKASLYEKETRLKTLQVQICDLEGKHTQQKQSAESQLAAMQRRINMVPKGDNSAKEQIQSLQMENDSYKDEIEAFRKELDRLRNELDQEKLETNRLKQVEQQKHENDRKLNEVTYQLKENEKKLNKLQTNARLSSPRKLRMSESPVKELSKDFSRIEVDIEEAQTKQKVEKILLEQVKKDQLSAIQSRKLKDELKALKDYIAELEQRLAEQQSKLPLPAAQPYPISERLDDIILNSYMASRPSTSVNYYYQAPNFNLTYHSKPVSRSNSPREDANNLDFKFERLLSTKPNQRSPGTKRQYQYDSQGYVTKAEKIVASPQPDRQVFLEVKRLKASPLPIYNDTEIIHRKETSEKRARTTRTKYQRFRLAHIKKREETFI